VTPLTCAAARPPEPRALGLEPLPHGRVRRDVLGHDLDRDITRQAQVTHAIHVAHAAGAERRNDFVLGETSAGGEGHDRG